MKTLCLIISTILIVNTLSEENQTSVEKEMDLVIDMLMNNEIHDYESVENDVERDIPVEEPIYSDGVWKCGVCDDINDSKLIYEETYDVEANSEEGYIDLQVGLVVNNMKCVTVTVSEAGALSVVKRVSGNCVGDSVTLRVSSAAQYEVRAYD